MVDASGESYYLTRSALFNRCNLTPWAIASQGFQDHPRPIDIAWVRLENQQFLAAMDAIPEAEERGLIFHDYALVRHWLHEERRPPPEELLRHSYVSVLRGWGFDSSGRYGAVLKGWAESRFGLRAIYHQGTLDAQEAWERYDSGCLQGSEHGVGTQLDLLYTFCQDELARRHPGQRWLTLYRGTHDPEAYLVKAGGTPPPDELVEFNTLSSFTADREVAWEFGSRVWAVRVPLAKVVFFSGLLPRSLLRGEQEYIVLGGDYRVRPLRC